MLGVNPIIFAYTDENGSHAQTRLTLYFQGVFLTENPGGKTFLKVAEKMCEKSFFLCD